MINLIASILSLIGAIAFWIYLDNYVDSLGRGPDILFATITVFCICGAIIIYCAYKFGAEVAKKRIYKQRIQANQYYEDTIQEAQYIKRTNELELEITKLRKEILKLRQPEAEESELETYRKRETLRSQKRHVRGEVEIDAFGESLRQRQKLEKEREKELKNCEKKICQKYSVSDLSELSEKGTAELEESKAQVEEFYFQKLGRLP